MILAMVREMNEHTSTLLEEGLGVRISTRTRPR